MADDVSSPGLSPTAQQDTPAAQLKQAVTRAPLQTQPVEHIYMESVFAPEFYREILANLPAKRHFHQLRHTDAMRADGSSTRLRMFLYPERLWMLPARQRRLWREVSRALMSRETQEAYLGKFAESLEGRFGRRAQDLSFVPVPILMCDQPGYRIGIHADADAKAITTQYYLPKDDSQRHLGTVFHEGRDGEAAARTKSLDYLPNSGYAFPVLPTESWHSVGQISEADGDRYSLMLTYYLQDTFLKWGKRRYDRLCAALGVSHL